MDCDSFAKDLAKFNSLQNKNLDFKIASDHKHLVEIRNNDTNHVFAVLFIKLNQVTVTVPDELNYISDVIILDSVLKFIEYMGLDVSR